MGGGRRHVSGRALACVGGSACALPGGFARVVGGMCGGWGCRLRLGPLRGTAGGRRDRRPNGPVAARPAPRTPCGSRGPGCRPRLGDATTPAPTAGPGFGPARPAPRRRSRGNTPPRRPHGAPDLSGSATIAENTPSRCPGGIRRMWLPHGMRPMPNGVRASGMPRHAERGRRRNKKDGQRRKADIARRMPTVASGPPIRQRCAPITRKLHAAFGISHTKT